MISQKLLAASEKPQRPRVVRLALHKLGQVTCRHTYNLVMFRGRLFLRCDGCGQETCGFVVYTPLKGQCRS